MVEVAELENAELRGEKRGEGRGMHDGKERLVMRLLSRRLGLVPLGVAEGVSRLTADELDDLGEALLDFASFDDARIWLATR